MGINDVSLLRDGLVHKPTFENQADDVHMSILFMYRDYLEW